MIIGIAHQNKRSDSSQRMCSHVRVSAAVKNSALRSVMAPRAIGRFWVRATSRSISASTISFQEHPAAWSREEAGRRTKLVVTSSLVVEGIETDAP